MIVKNKTKKNIDELTIHEFIIYSDKGEQFRRDSVFYIEDKKFKVFNSKRTNEEPLNPEYIVQAIYKPQITIHNYDTIDFIFEVSSIERTDPKTIHILKYNGRTEITFDNSKDCLQEYLQLLILHKEACSSDGYKKFR